MLALETNFFNLWSNKLDKYLSCFLAQEKRNNLIKFIFSLLQNLSPIIILYLSFSSMIQNLMSLGEVFAIYSLSSNLFLVVNSFSSSLIKYQNCKLLLERLNDITSSHCEKNTNNLIKHNMNGNIEFKHVYFSYSKGSKCVIEDVNFKIKSGSKIGIVGTSGAGKSTLAKLLVGLYEPVSGDILFDNVNIKHINKKYLRKQMGIIPQDATLFNKSIYDNITVNAEHASLDDVKKVCRLAQISKEIESIPMGYNTPISECGQNLSGGQRQRIVLARALINKPKLLIFDEATSSLDNISEKKISTLLKRSGCTRIIIAHRLSTILDSDIIFVMENGKIISKGTHQELIKKCKLYQKLYFAKVN